MAKRSGLLLASLSLLLAACTGTWRWPIAGSGTPVEIPELATGVRNISPSVPTLDLDALVRGNTTFAIDLYRRLIQGPEGNLAFGPYSISSAFALLNAGASGRTQQQLADTLHFILPASRLDTAFNELSIILESRQAPRLTLATTVRLFGQVGYPFLDSYLRELTANFGAPIAVADFRDESEQDRQLINAWASDKTSGRIADLLPEGSIDLTTRLVLVNAMYLHARWQTQFPPAATRSLPFQLNDGSSVDAPTMTEMATARAHVGDAYQAVELPYVGGQLSMLLVMPADLQVFERALSPEALADVIGSLDEKELSLALPRFSVRTGLTLNDTLRRMGVTDAFDASRADFSKMVDTAAVAEMNPPETVALSQAVHQSWVRVSESGTEATPSSAGVAANGPGPSLTVRFDHPFLWFIRDQDSGTILFMGRTTDPTARD